MPKALRAASGTVIVSLLALAVSHSGSPPKDFKLLFSNAQDITNTWGELHFGATPMQKMCDCTDPGFVLACCLPQAGKTWEVYGQSYKLDEAGKEYEKKNAWRIVHAGGGSGEYHRHVQPGPVAPGPGPGYHDTARAASLLKKCALEDFAEAKDLLEEICSNEAHGA